MRFWFFCTCFIFVYAQTDADSDYEEDEIEWECGTDSFSKYISENQIDIDCPKLKQTVNQCCINHDKCYDDQRGRKLCDDMFCNCLDSVTTASQICNKEDSPLFCGLVREFGEDAYLRSGNGTIVAINETETATAKPLKESEHLVHDYEYIVSHNTTNGDVTSLEEDIKHIEESIKDVKSSH
ncbi:unnamed protein product [Auanema sp. JU1783]|nr:unnamed protein product [Auanema sp. JU1783]